MTLLNNNKTFELFPALNLNLLQDKNHDRVNLMACNMQIPALTFNKNVNNVRRKKIINLVSLKDDLYFYTGLKDYYKINIKKDILSDFFVEEKKKLIYLDKQNNKRSAFILGDYVFPIKKNYEFIKRRFVLNMHTRARLKTKEALVENIAQTLDDLNSILLASMLLTAQRTNNLPKFRFFQTKRTRGGFNGIYHFLGLNGLFLHWKSTKFQYEYIHWKVKEIHSIKKQKRQLAYILEFLPNRHYYLLQYLYTNLNNKRVTSLFATNGHLFVKVLLQEFMKIKLFLRFYFLRMRFIKDKKLIREFTPRSLKFMLIVFNFARKVYKDVFEYVFNLCALQSLYIDSLQYDNIIKNKTCLNTYQVASIYNCNQRLYRVSINSKRFVSRRNVIFEDFGNGILTRKTGGFFKKTSKYSYRFSKKLPKGQSTLCRIRYRNSLFAHRYNLLAKHNDFYFQYQSQEMLNEIDIDNDNEEVYDEGTEASFFNNNNKNL